MHHFFDVSSIPALWLSHVRTPTSDPGSEKNGERWAKRRWRSFRGPRPTFVDAECLRTFGWKILERMGRLLDSNVVGEHGQHPFGSHLSGPRSGFDERRGRCLRRSSGQNQALLWRSVGSNFGRIALWAHWSNLQLILHSHRWKCSWPFRPSSIAYLLLHLLKGAYIDPFVRCLCRCVHLLFCRLDDYGNGS